jgi:ParB family transcriptional regulator, chromosome partitioning protein
MNDSKKKRMSMLDSLAASGAPMPAGTMMSTNRALRSARDAVDAHQVWDLDPASIDDARFADRLDPKDVADLRASIEANGQTVPILVRRHPSLTDRYLLVYGRRRLEAIRASETVQKIRALIASLDDGAALRAQVSENTGRRDLSYIERALFAQELLDADFGNQAQIAEVLNATKSSISMAISVARTVGGELARAIGPALGIGRPRWEALAKDIEGSDAERSVLSILARDTRTRAAEAEVIDGQAVVDPSTAAFEAVVRHLRKMPVVAKAPVKPIKAKVLRLNGKTIAQVQRMSKSVRLDLTMDQDGFAIWFENQSQGLIEELHARWKQQATK